MTTVFKLGARPETFAPIPVKFTGPDGAALVIPSVVFEYRTRSEYGAWVDKLNANSAASYSPAPGEKFSVEALMKATGKGGAAEVARVIKSWGIDMPITAETLALLYDESPAGGAALVEAYRAAAVEGHLGN